MMQPDYLGWRSRLAAENALLALNRNVLPVARGRLAFRKGEKEVRVTPVLAAMH